MNKVLVTGISGFIGREVANNLLSRNIQPIGIDRTPKSIEGVTTIQGDIQDSDLLQRIIKEVDGVINLAGVLGTSELLDATQEAVNINILSAVKIYDICLSAKIPLVQIATGNKTWPSVYPITKECAVTLAQVYAKDAGLKVSVVRAMNAYGPYQKHAPVRKFIPNLIRWAFLNQPCELYGNGLQIMDPVWVGDVARILVDALFKAGNPEIPFDHVYEAGTGVRWSVWNVADLVWQQIRGERTAPKVFLPMRIGEPKHSVTVANTRTLLPLGIQNFIDLEEGLAQTIEWYRQHPEILGLTKKDVDA